MTSGLIGLNQPGDPSVISAQSIQRKFLGMLINQQTDKPDKSHRLLKMAKLYKNKEKATKRDVSI